MQTKNISIQLIRITAMFMIILDHILNYISFPLQSLIVQVTNSGVFIFLFLSGYLFGQRKVLDWKQWFLKRLTRICIPLWIFMVIDFIVEFVLWKQFDVKYVFIYLFNVQGIFGTTLGGMNLWFLTLLMICYLMTPLLQSVRQFSWNKYMGGFILLCVMILQITLAYITNGGMVAGHTLSWCVIAVGVYAGGYFLGQRILAEYVSGKRVCVVTLLFVLAVGMALHFHQNFDGQVIYDRIIIYYGMLVVDLWICTVIAKIGASIQREWVLRIINYWDGISYEVYIVHGLLIATLTLNVLQRAGAVAYIISTFMLSWLAAVVLHKMVVGVMKCLKRCTKSCSAKSHINNG